MRSMEDVDTLEKSIVTLTIVDISNYETSFRYL
nr:MAG TPA: hypothetical protein [Caudoviricetes sp.]